MIHTFEWPFRGLIKLYTYNSRGVITFTCHLQHGSNYDLIVDKSEMGPEHLQHLLLIASNVP